MVKQALAVCYTFAVVSLLLSEVALAARLKSFCTVPENSTQITGINVDQRLPIASVSKVFTSLFAIVERSAQQKIYTQFYYTDVGGGFFDVHIKGSHEPYFGRESLQWLISKLNEAGVFKIRRLTFDENFKYYHETDRRMRVGRKLVNPVSGKDDMNAPAPAVVQAELMQKGEIFKNYAKTVKLAAADGVTLAKQLVFNPQKIEFLRSTSFVESAKTKKGFIGSPDLLHMMKLMNWNSNNHAANQIFQYSGGLERFNDVFYNKMKFTEADLKFVNGSGQNADLDGNGRLYNEATCKTVVRVVKGLKKNLEKQNSKLEDAMAVVGGDLNSTVSGVTYKNATTNLSVLAKSGTVGTNVTLAGMISAKSGNHFFFFNVETAPPPAKAKNKLRWSDQEEKRCRAVISAKLTALIKQLGGAKPIDYKIKVYDPERFEDVETTSSVLKDEVATDEQLSNFEIFD